MNRTRCLKIADRIHTWLLQELGQGIERERMLADPLYARDVLLVCDAYVGTPMPILSAHFRTAAADEVELDESESPAFSPSRFLSSLFGTQAADEPLADAAWRRDPD